MAIFDGVTCNKTETKFGGPVTEPNLKVTKGTKMQTRRHAESGSTRIARMSTKTRKEKNLTPRRRTQRCEDSNFVNSWNSEGRALRRPRQTICEMWQTEPNRLCKPGALTRMNAKSLSSAKLVGRELQRMTPKTADRQRQSVPASP